jgi:hypothetical protein
MRLLVWILLSASFRIAAGFVVLPTSTCPHLIFHSSPLPTRKFVTTSSTTFSLRGRWNDDESDTEAQDAQARNEARTDVRNLLTQRAIQSFVFLVTECRDPHSGKWLEEFLGTSNSLQFHGTGAGYMEQFGGTWDGPLLAMMEAPKDVVIVSAKRSGKGHKGWSKNNPYLEGKVCLLVVFVFELS